MSNGNDQPVPARPTASPLTERKPYATPHLVRYGQVQALTGAGTANNNEGQPGSKKTGGSDRRLKENLKRIGIHPLGFGLYLFDYRAEFRDLHGSGRQFGVMADEVRGVVPGAVRTGSLGYDEVDYSVIGIRRFGA